MDFMKNAFETFGAYFWRISSKHELGLFRKYDKGSFGVANIKLDPRFAFDFPGFNQTLEILENLLS